MSKTDPINRFIESATTLLPDHLQPLKEELETNLRQGIQHLFNNLQMVSRDEFEIQQRVLAKTQEKLTVLEEKITELEQKSS